VQDGLLPTASPALQSCWADWASLQDNSTANDKVFDMTGNLRELTKSATHAYPAMGGGYLTASPDGASCGVSYFTVGATVSSQETGFRCCFGQDPTL
jgi:hypothetical protein